MESFQSLGELIARGGFPQMKSEKPASASPSVECKCSLCLDRGWLGFDVPFDHPDFGKVVRCSCMKVHDEIKRRELFLRLCKLPQGTEDRIFETFKVRPGLKEAHQAALAVAEEKLQWLTLVGGVDSGKSHLAIAIARQWLERGRPARYAVVPEFLDELRRGYHPNADMSYEEEFLFYKNVDMLLLDDLGMECPTPWAQEKLDTLVNYRYENALPLVVTTNLSLDQLSPRIASRLQRVDFGKVVNIKAQEYRLWRQK